MTRLEKIQIIVQLYPADTGYEKTAEIGKQLLFKALAKCWRSLPEEVLGVYAQLCVQHEHEEAKG